MARYASATTRVLRGTLTDLRIMFYFDGVPLSAFCEAGMPVSRYWARRLRRRLSFRRTHVHG